MAQLDMAQRAPTELTWGDDGMGCRSCRQDLEHCHEALVEHDDGTVECGGGPPCPGRRDLHEWWLPCHELAPPCGCSPAGTQEVSVTGQAASQPGPAASQPSAA